MMRQVCFEYPLKCFESLHHLCSLCYRGCTMEMELHENPTNQATATMRLVDFLIIQILSLTGIVPIWQKQNASESFFFFLEKYLLVLVIYWEQK